MTRTMLIAICLSGAAAGCGAPEEDDTSGVEEAISSCGTTSCTSAVSATTFLSSIGVGTHVGQGIDNASDVATALGYAGIRVFRDSTHTNHTDDYLRIFDESGAQGNFVTTSNVATELAFAEKLHAAGALLSLEGPNEPNNFAVTYDGITSGRGSTSFLGIAELQRDLYAAVHGDAKLAGIPVFASSEAGGSEPDNVGLQYLRIPKGAGTKMPDGTVYADYANTHNYVCGGHFHLVDNNAWKATDPVANGDWDNLYVEYARTWKKHFTGYAPADLATLPHVTTETGWVTKGANAITEEQQARLFLDLYLAGFEHGIRYTFVYMLRDDPAQGYWGLFDRDWNPKKSGQYLHNFTTILDDTGERKGDKLAFSIANQPSTVHTLLLEKSSGLFELVVWDERFAGGSDAITVQLGKTFSSAKIYDPTKGTTPIKKLGATSSVHLTLTDHPVIIEL